MLKKIALGLAALVVLFVVVVAVQPSEFRLARSVRIDAPASVPYALIEDLHGYDTWNPWATYDPNMKKTFSGADRGKGAVYAWEGEKVGAGSMTVTEATPHEKVRVALVFTKPFAATNEVVFDVVPQGPGSEVTWTMSGQNAFLHKAIGLFVDMDKMVGADFERGLADLKRLSEDRAKAAAQAKAPSGETPAAAQAPAAPVGSAPASK